VPSLPAPPQTERTSRSTINTPPSLTPNSHASINSWGVHNIRLLSHNPILRRPMCGQATV
jgi:hypothetical protein